MQSLLKCIFFSVVACLSFFCAGQAPPSGGPPDTTPPVIVSSSPIQGALHFKGNTISLSFSKYVNRTSVEQSVFVSPPLRTLSFDWSGSDVDIHFSDTLRPQTTYIVTVGTDVVDLRRDHPNKMAKAFALSFSTGDKLDSALISGRVIDDHADGIMLYAYRLDDRLPDTLNPSHVRPDYLTQTGTGGGFSLSNMAYGTYRLLAIRDQYRNLLYDVQVDDFGTAYEDFKLSSEHPYRDDIYIKMSKEDTTAPFLSSAHAIDRYHVLLRFSEPMDTSYGKSVTISITDTMKNTPLQVFDLSFNETSLSEAQVVTAGQESTAVYRLIVQGAKDRSGNVIHHASSMGIFNGSSLADTLRPVIELVGISDSAKSVQVDDTLHFSFGKAVWKLPFEHALSLKDAKGETIAGHFLWSNSIGVSFMPDEPLTLGEWYRFKLIADSLSDLAGFGYHDSVWTRRFRMVEEKMLSSVQGTVSDQTNSNKGDIHIFVNEVSKKNIKQREIILHSPGKFETNFLQEGSYTFSAYRDADSNGVYTFGKPFPFQPSERFSLQTDTMKVRARWPLEGLTIKIE